MSHLPVSQGNRFFLTHHKLKGQRNRWEIRPLFYLPYVTGISNKVISPIESLGSFITVVIVPQFVYTTLLMCSPQQVHFKTYLKIYCTWQKIRNSVRSQIEECSCCGGAVNCLDTTHNHSSSKEQVKLVVYSLDSGNNTGSTAKVDHLKETEVNGENIIWFLPWFWDTDILLS